MIRVHVFRVLAAAVLPVLLACGEVPNAPVSASAEVACESIGLRETPAAVVTLLIDHTGSYSVPHSVVYEDAAAFVSHLPAASVLEVRYLSAASYPDIPNRALVARIPPLAPEPVPAANIFDPDERRRFRREQLRYERSLACVSQARRDIAQAILRLEAPGAPANRSDITGGLARAAENFAAFPPGVRRVVVLWSDLVEHVLGGPQLTLDLGEVAVLVRTVRSGITQVQTATVEAEFTRAMEAAGARVHLSSAQLVAWPVVLAATAALPSPVHATEIQGG